MVWGTGGGGDLANDTGSSSGDQTAAGNFRVLLADTVIVPDYAGTSFGLPGLWQVNFTIPADFKPDCFNRLQISADGVLSNHAILAVAPAGETLHQHCLRRGGAGRTRQRRQTHGRQSARFVGGLHDHDGESDECDEWHFATITGLFTRYDAEAIIELASGLRIGPCIIYRKTAAQPHLGIGIPSANLSAGPNLGITGPGVPANSTMTRGDPTNYYFVPDNLNAGTYTISGPGGPDIGPFEASVDVPANFMVPDFPNFDRINRANPFTFNWTGGGGDDGTVTINILTSKTISGSNNDPDTWIIARSTVFCQVPASLGTFTVSPEVLSYLTLASLDPLTGTDGNLSINAMKESAAGTFRPPLTAGGTVDFGGYLYSLGFTRNIAVD